MIEPGNNTCGYCRMPLFSGSVACTPCPKCLDVPHDDLRGKRSAYRYCSPEHRALDFDHHQSVCNDRLMKRYLARVGTICAMLYTCNRKNLIFFEILSCVKTETHRDLVIAHSDKPRRGQQWLPADMLGALSANDSINATALYAPLLAWLLEDLPVHIREFQAHPVMDRQTRIFELYSDGLFEREPEDLHVYTTVTPCNQNEEPLEGIALDVTSMQYEKEIKTHTESDYHHYHVQQNPSQFQWGFGYHYMGVAAEQSTSFNKGRSSFWAGMIASNSLIFGMIQSFGGRHGLYEQSHTVVVEQLGAVQHWLTRNLQMLRHRIDEIPQGHAQEAQHVDNVIQWYTGEGHAMMLAALNKRVMSNAAQIMVHSSATKK